MAFYIKTVHGQGRKRLNKLILTLDGQKGEVGWDKVKYPDGTSVAMIATQNEYGNPKKNIPPRPFLRPTVNEKKNEWRAIVKTASQRALRNGENPRIILLKLVKNAEKSIKAAIRKVFSPQLAPSTILARIRKRASYTRLKTRGARTKQRNALMTNARINKPLIDTGYMLKTLRGKVTGKTRKSK